MRVYGSRVSYYTGKLETHLRYLGLEYESLPLFAHTREARAGAGVIQMPVVQLDDGRWLSDSTPILAWLDAAHDAPSIYPDDPVMRFVALLIEDYADEWLWRPAMHYRWSYRLDRELLSGLLADEQLGHMRLPRWLKKRRVAARQLQGFVRGDGVRDATWSHVEQGYLTALERLEAIFAKRRFVLGERPTIADFGLMGPMLRHFGQDPTPSEIMRSRASRVYAWVARMWNTRATDCAGALVPEIDAPLAALLREVAETHLAQLDQNARAFARGESRHAQTIQGCRYERVPSSRYRVWCLEQLRAAWAALDDDACERLRAFVPAPHVDVLDGDGPERASDYDAAGAAPFNRAINVFGRGVPD